MHIIAVVGPHQCGSTMFFNTFRLICEGHNIPTDSCFLDDYINGKYNKDAGYIVIKCHERLPTNDFPPGTLTILPNRHPLDSMISFFTRFRDAPDVKVPNPEEDATAYIKRGKEYILYNQKNFNDWKDRSTVISYEEYMHMAVEEKANILKQILTLHGHNALASDMTIIEKSIIEVSRLHVSKDIIENDILENRKSALNNPVYRKTLITQSHNTANGKTQKYLSLPVDVKRAFASDDDIIHIMNSRGYSI